KRRQKGREEKGWQKKAGGEEGRQTGQEKSQSPRQKESDRETETQGAKAESAAEHCGRATRTPNSRTGGCRSAGPHFAASAVATIAVGSARIDVQFQPGPIVNGWDAATLLAVRMNCGTSFPR